MTKSTVYPVRHMKVVFMHTVVSKKAVSCLACDLDISRWKGSNDSEAHGYGIQLLRPFISGPDYGGICVRTTGFHRHNRNRTDNRHTGFKRS